MRVTWLIHVSDMTNTCVWHDTQKWLLGPRPHCILQVRVWHDSLMCAAWRDTLSYVTFRKSDLYLVALLWKMISNIRHDSLTCAAWRDTWSSWPDSFLCMTWPLPMCHVPHSYVWHASFLCITWLRPMCDMPHSYAWHDFFLWVACLSFMCITRLIHGCDIPHSYVWYASFLCITWLSPMGWLRLVGSLKFQVSLAKVPYK